MLPTKLANKGISFGGATPTNQGYVREQVGKQVKLNLLRVNFY